MKNLEFKIVFSVLMLIFSWQISAQKINKEYSCEGQPAEIKKIFQQNGKTFVVVDMYQIVEREPSADFVNNDKKLRTFQVNSAVKIIASNSKTGTCEDYQGSDYFLKNKNKIMKKIPLISVKNGVLVNMNLDCYN